MGVAMTMTNVSKWKWSTLTNKNGLFVCIDNDKNISMPRIRDINMIDGIITIEERFLVDAVEEGDLFVLSMHLASSDAIEWVTTQLVERAKSSY